MSTKRSKIPSWCRATICSVSRRRKLDDIRKLGGNSPEDDLAFATAARVSEITQGVYSTLMRPAVRAMVTETSAELMRRSHPNRLRFEMFADENPLMRPVADWAETVRDNRRPVSPDNPFLAFERMVSDMIASGLEMWGKARDAATRRSSSIPTVLRLCRRWSVCAPTTPR